MDPAAPTPSRYPARVGPYRLERPLGLGATGCVFEAQDDEGRAVAVKVIHPHLSFGEDLVSRIEREARLAAVVDSEHTVRLLGSGSADGYLYLAMQLVSGQSLADLIRTHGALPEREAVRIFRGIAEGLADLHAAGIVHRDVKPSNVLLGEDGEVLLTDYGIARDILESASTTTLDFAGSLAYAAPEQAGGRWDRRADIYGAGSTLVHMLTGSPPERHGLLSGIPRGLGRSLAEQLRTVDPRIAAIATRCLALDPWERYQSASEVTAALDALPSPPRGLSAGVAALRRRGGRARRRLMWAASKPPLVAATVGAALVAGAGLAFVFVSGDSTAAPCDVRAPENLKAEQGATGQVAVTWERSDACAPAGYQLAFSSENNRGAVPASQVVDTSISDGRRSSRYFLNGLKVGSPYYIWVEAYGPDRRPVGGPHAEIVVGTTCDKAPPPKALEALGTTANSVQLRWDSGGGCTTGFYVLYSDHDDIKAVNGGQRASDGVIDTGGRSEWTVPGLTTGQTYSFWVFAYGPGDSQSRTWAGPVTAALYPLQPEPATLIEPQPGTVLTSDTVEFRWAPGRNVLKYGFRVSGVAPDRADVFQMRDGPDTAATVAGIPLDGRTIYVWLMSADGTDANYAIRRYEFATRDSGQSKLERTIELAGTQPWLDTGIQFQPGDRVAIEASGTVFDSPSTKTGYGPDGGCPAYGGVMVPSLPCMALVGQYLGVAPFLVGSKYVFFPDRAGTLAFGVNDSEHRDNRGSWTIKVRITR